MAPSIPPDLWARKKRRFTSRQLIALVGLPLLVAPITLSALAEASVYQSGVAAVAAGLRSMTARVPTAEGIALLGLMAALYYWAFRAEAPDAEEAAWELLTRAATMERADHIEASLISYAHIAGKFAHRPVGHAAQLSLDVLHGKARAGPRRGMADTRLPARRSAHLRLALSRIVAHP